MGINIINSIETEEFEERVHRFLNTLAEAQPEKPVFCIDLFTCRWDLGDASAMKKIEAFRRIVREAVEATDTDYVIHLPGEELLSWNP
jgi:hypothetical protein